MSDINTTQTALTAAEAAITLHTVTGWRTALGKVGTVKPEERVTAFAAYMEENGGTGKETYLQVRETLRAHLRDAETLQRARKARERSLVADGQGNSAEREQIYMARISDRRFITRLLNARAAGKAWSAQAKTADADTTV